MNMAGYLQKQFRVSTLLKGKLAHLEIKPGVCWFHIALYSTILHYSILYYSTVVFKRCAEWQGQVCLAILKDQKRLYIV